MTFFVMNLACFLLKIGSAPNFRPGFKFFTWQSAFVGSILSASAMFFIDETYASTAVCMLIFLFLLIHFLSPPKHWGDVSQNLIYHQVRKYLLRLKPEHIKFWRPQIILLINDPRKHIRLVQFCNSMKKGGLYILGHVIVTDDFNAGVQEAKIQQAAWTRYISEFSRIKAFVQLTMSPSITWGVRNLILSSGLGGLRPNVAVLGFYNMDELRESQPLVDVPQPPTPQTPAQQESFGSDSKFPGRRRGDTTARLVEGFLPTDVIRKEGMMDATSYMTILEDLALRYKINVAVGKGFDSLESPRRAARNSKRYIDLWPIQMSAEVEAEGKNVLTSNFDTYTLILQLGYILHSVPTWKKAYRLRVLVFVEYEDEVEEERGRVKALLDRLRIEADVVVFWLACGDLATYETIVHGRSTTPETESAVNECLRHDEWWRDVQNLRRGRAHDTTTSRELAAVSNVLESTSAPDSSHYPASTAAQSTERRRASVALLSELPKKSTVSQLARLGINMGIRTQNLPTNVFDDSDDEGLSDADSERESSDSSLGDFNGAASDGDAEDMDPSRKSLLPVTTRRKSQGDHLDQPTGLGNVGTAGEAKAEDNTRWQSYGTMSSKASGTERETPAGPSTSRPYLGSTDPPPIKQAERPSAHVEAARADSPSRTRHHSRHGSSAIRFSSNLTPETTITDENGAEPRIMFAQSESGYNSRNGRPSLLRQASSNRVADRNLAEKYRSGQGETPRSVSFADPESEPRRQPAFNGVGAGDAQVNISELLGYFSNRTTTDGSASSYSTQGLPLSFNDVPGRAQHLILNELMRKNSRETAVLFTTLPIPEEGTCQSEEASVQYLADIEILCNELPPVLLVLSNNMTVTVSL
jgi:potassium/chloride transporter 9